MVALSRGMLQEKALSSVAFVRLWKPAVRSFILAFLGGGLISRLWTHRGVKALTSWKAPPMRSFNLEARLSRASKVRTWASIFRLGQFEDVTIPHGIPPFVFTINNPLHKKTLKNTGFFTRIFLSKGVFLTGTTTQPFFKKIPKCRALRSAVSTRSS
jgi:hypothetical protein